MKALPETPHRRFNPLTQEWVLVSPQRNKRPWQGKQETLAPAQGVSFDKDCYLCPGNKRAQNSINENYTDTFVFINDFSALLPQKMETKIAGEQEELFQWQHEQGICKVICFSPDHSITLPLMSVSAIEKVVYTWMSEYALLSKLDDINYVQIFENKGEIMGCSNPHPHGQIWASNSIPDLVMKEQQSQLAYFETHDKTLLADYLQQESDKQERIVISNNSFVVLVPYWAVWPFETMIISKRSFSRITDMDAGEVTDFAAILKQLTTLYDNIFETSFPYSAGIHQAPTDGATHSEWHFHMHFYPPLLRSATIKKFMVGYELLAGPQRDITPEAAAEILRKLPTTHYAQHA